MFLTKHTPEHNDKVVLKKTHDVFFSRVSLQKYMFVFHCKRTTRGSEKFYYIFCNVRHQSSVTDDFVDEMKVTLQILRCANLIFSEGYLLNLCLWLGAVLRPTWTCLFSKMYYRQIRLCEIGHIMFIYIYIYIEHRILKHEKHLQLLSSGTKLFITFEFKGSSK